MSPQSEDEIEAGWGDKLLKIKGMLPIIILLLAVSLYFTGTLLIKMSDTPIRAITESQTRTSAEHKELSGIIVEDRVLNAADHTALVKTQERIADSLDQQVFFLSKTERERAQYQIEMPDSLRKKLTTDRGR
jgi:hypothetical protein